jgi:hypothetical protein
VGKGKGMRMQELGVVVDGGGEERKRTTKGRESEKT